MVYEVVTEYARGSTVMVRALVYDEDATLVDATTAKVSIYDPDGVLTAVSGADMTHHDTGVYEYFYNTTAESDSGDYVAEITITDGEGDGEKTFIEYVNFTLR